MRLVLNWLLLCLLALALPLQGLAAVGARPCQPDAETLVRPATAAAKGGHAMHAMHGLAATPHDAQAAAHGSHGVPSDSAPPLAHLHGEGDAHASGSPAAPADSPDDAHTDGGHPAGHKCSNCAACCMGAALPVTVAVFAASATPVALVPTQPAAAPGWLPPQPQRPPRPIAP